MPILQLASSGSSSGKESEKTFVFENEGHTLGNALHCVIASYPDVQFCGYTIPHPAENKMNFRIQMYKGRAVDALRRGLEDLVKMCDHTTKVFDEAVLAYKHDHKETTDS